MPIKRLDNLLNLNSDGGLGDIVQRARDMDELKTTLQQALPEIDAASMLAANIRDDGELVVLAASSAWAAKLRFEADTLLAAARATGAKVTRCRVRVSRGS